MAALAPLADDKVKVANRYSLGSYALAEAQRFVILIACCNSTERAIDGSETV